MVEFLKKLFNNTNRKGIPFPMIRDPKTGVGSITASLVVISSGLCAICVLLTIASALSKLTGLFDKFAETQQAFMNAFNLSFQFFIASGSFYVGRKFQRDSNGAMTLDGKEQGQDILKKSSD